jgi:hypothetical protein
MSTAADIEVGDLLVWRPVGGRGRKALIVTHIRPGLLRDNRLVIDGKRASVKDGARILGLGTAYLDPHAEVEIRRDGRTLA